jgi:hypothetical protein
LGLIAGLCLRNLGMGGLGVLIMFSSVCWRIFEEETYQRQLEDDLNACDSLLEAKLRAQLVEGLERGAKEAPSMRSTGGISTGADEGLAEQIARRRKESAEQDKQMNLGVYQ